MPTTKTQRKPWQLKRKRVAWETPNYLTTATTNTRRDGKHQVPIQGHNSADVPVEATCMIMCATTCQSPGCTLRPFIHTPALFCRGALQCKHSNELQNISVFCKTYVSTLFSLGLQRITLEQRGGFYGVFKQAAVNPFPLTMLCSATIRQFLERYCE